MTKSKTSKKMVSENALVVESGKYILEFTLKSELIMKRFLFLLAAQLIVGCGNGGGNAAVDNAGGSKPPSPAPVKIKDPEQVATETFSAYANGEIEKLQNNEIIKNTTIIHEPGAS